MVAYRVRHRAQIVTRLDQSGFDCSVGNLLAFGFGHSLGQRTAHCRAVIKRSKQRGIGERADDIADPAQHHLVDRLHTDEQQGEHPADRIQEQNVALPDEEEMREPEQAEPA